VFSNFLFTVLVSNVPLLGMILPLVFIPSFGIAVQQACRMISEGQRVPPAVLLTGFRKDTIGPLCKMGLVYFGICMLLMVAVAPFISVEAMQASVKQMQAKNELAIDPGTVIAVVAFCVLFNLTVLCLSFTPALTCWKRMPTFKAIFYSIVAVLGAFRPMLVMLAYWLAIAWGLLIVVATLFGRSQFAVVALMWLALISTLILQCAIFAAYRQIIGLDEAP